MYLRCNDLWEIVTIAEVMNNDLPDAEKRKFKKREKQALASIYLGILTNLQISVRSSETAQDAWENLEKHFQLKTLSKKIFYRRKLYSARMEKRQNMTEHINHIKTLSEHVETIDDRIAEKNLVILSISLSEEHDYLITALQTIAKDHLTWDYIRDGLIHQSEKKKYCEAETLNKALFVSKLTKKSIKCHYCKLLQEEKRPEEKGNSCKTSK